MTMETKNDIFESHVRAYLQSDKAGKSQLLEHICALTGMHRKAAIRKFNALQKRSLLTVPAGRGRPLRYTPDVDAALHDVWVAASGICGELLRPAIAEYTAILQRDGQWQHGAETTAKLLAMSEGTVKLRLAKFASFGRVRHGLSSTKPSGLKELIPIFTGPWHNKPPGYGQLDTVVHCGSSLQGDMVYTVNWTDVATLWGGRGAQWNKGQRATQESLSAIRDRLPFAMLGAHPDTGSEFINWHLKDWCEAQGIELTRSRPYHKNDNAYVEQKNGHVVRRFLGYTRYDCKDTVPAVNELYEVLDLYLNHFVPSRKCIEKVRIGSKYKRKYDTAQTPYARILASVDIPETVKDRLQTEHETLNPLTLKHQVDTLIARILTIQEEYEKYGNQTGG
jgi:hypothetical protein